MESEIVLEIIGLGADWSDRDLWDSDEESVARLRRKLKQSMKKLRKRKAMKQNTDSVRSVASKKSTRNERILETPKHVKTDAVLKEIHKKKQLNDQSSFQHMESHETKAIYFEKLKQEPCDKDFSKFDSIKVKTEFPLENTASQITPYVDKPKEKVRYFFLKSFCQQHIETSYRENRWSTRKMNEEKLNEAYRTCDKVILFFCILSTQCIKGYAVMTSPIGDKKGHWEQTPETKGIDFDRLLGGSFDVKWAQLQDVPFAEIEDIINPWTNKTITRSRDGQELPLYIGEKLTKLIDEKALKSFKRKSETILPQSSKKQKLNSAVHDEQQKQIYLVKQEPLKN